MREYSRQRETGPYGLGGLQLGMRWRLVEEFMTTQPDLISIESLMPIGNSERSLAMLSKWFRDGLLQIPAFQRDFVWGIDQIKGWIESIEDQQAIGVIVTYQLERGGPVFLADGLQRLTATERYMRNPEQYKCPYSKDQAERYCEMFSITLQHRHYKNHSIAMDAFQKLNRGTSLTPFEYYSGILRLNGDAGRLILEEIPKIIDSYERPLVNTQKVRRETLHRYYRDSLALFYQYITKTKIMKFWEVAKKNVEDYREKSLERLLATEIESWTIEETEKKLADFEKHIANQVELIIYKKKEAGIDGLQISRAANRWLLHLATWRRNAERPVRLFDEFLEKFFAIWQGYPSVSTLFPMSGDPPKTTTLQMQTLNSLKMICEYLECDLYKGQKREKKMKLRNGLHESHVLPFSEYGNGKTFSEPGLLNMARGNREL